jgi:hypothetical protein
MKERDLTKEVNKLRQENILLGELTRKAEECGNY